MQRDQRRHPDLQELLAWLDGDAPGQSSDTGAHLESCARCRAEVDGLRETRAALRDMPALRPARDGWTDVQKAMGLAVQAEQPVHPASMHAWLRPAAAMAASVLLVVGLVLGLQDEPVVRPAPSQIAMQLPATAPIANRTTGMGGQLASLVAESRRLEQSLIAQQRTSRVMSLGQAGTVSALRDQIALVDNLLHARDAELDNAGRERLWRQRVRLMQGLIDAQARPAVWTEF